jgi:hypothetical protein
VISKKTIILKKHSIILDDLECNIKIKFNNQELTIHQLSIFKPNKKSTYCGGKIVALIDLFIDNAIFTDFILVKVKKDLFYFLNPVSKFIPIGEKNLIKIQKYILKNHGEKL